MEVSNDLDIFFIPPHFLLTADAARSQCSRILNVWNYCAGGFEAVVACNTVPIGGVSSSPLELALLRRRMRVMFGEDDVR